MKSNLIHSFSKDQFQSVIDSRIEQVVNHYFDSEDTYVFVEGPRWSTLGFEKIAKGWIAYGDSPINVKDIRTIEGPFGREDNGMAWIGQIIEMDVLINKTLKTVKFRGTFVLRKCEDSKWRIEHEHFSQPAEDPYGTGDWLESE